MRHRDAQAVEEVDESRIISCLARDLFTKWQEGAAYTRFVARRYRKTQGASGLPRCNCPGPAVRQERAYSSVSANNAAVASRLDDDLLLLSGELSLW